MTLFAPKKAKMTKFHKSRTAYLRESNNCSFELEKTLFYKCFIHYEVQIGLGMKNSKKKVQRKYIDIFVVNHSNCLTNRTMFDRTRYIKIRIADKVSVR